jgi:thioredoxin 1
MPARAKWDWRAKKPPVYCRPHGRRILGFDGGTGLCERCIPKKGDEMTQVTDETFEKEVLQSDVPVLVDFYADWCGPCQTAAPSIEAIGKDYAGRIKVVKVDVQGNPKRALEHGVRGIPNFAVFKGGQRTEQFVGWGENRAGDIRAALDAALASKA